MHQQAIMEATKRLLKIALVGAPNAGKSTLLNKLVLSDVSCVSNKVHTTRKNVLAVYTEANTQLEFYDSPGIVTREHLLKHRLEDSLSKDPAEAAQRCDLIAVVVDSSNPREKRKLNKGLLKMLREHDDKESFLILNKVDLVKDKRELLDIGSRLTEGCLANKPLLPESELREIMKRRKLREIKPTSKYVIELDGPKKPLNLNDSMSNRLSLEEIGYKNFSEIFSISALNDDGVDSLRETMMRLAKPVDQWPHGPDYLTSQNSKETVFSIIRDLELLVPNKYLAGKLIGEKGAVIFNITNESRIIIQKVLGCDVKLNISVKSKHT